MRTIKADNITKAVADLTLKANCSLRSDLLGLIKSAYKKETNKKAKAALGAIIKNARIARQEKLAICQDTGLPLVFVEAGQNVKVLGNFRKAVMKGIALGYKAANFRKSIVYDPILRGKPIYEGAIIHTDIVKGERLKITVMPKGFGCENKSQLKMFLPTASIEEIKDFVIQAVKKAGPDACPPYIVGVGIGGAADYASLLAKKALLRSLYIPTLKLEKDLLKAINALSIGPMGLGGRTTCLAVNVETYPTHIAGLPVAVNISCHALRSASIIL